MTLDQAMTKAACELDAVIAQARGRFEQDLIDHEAPCDQLDDLLDWTDDYWAAWRAETLNLIRQWLEREF